jgi:DNA-binding protein HU-beta
MTKNDLVKEIAKRTGVGSIDVVRIIESAMGTIRDSMSKGTNVYLRSFGTFQVKKRAKKTARNISKKTTMIIPEHYAPAFKPAKEFVGKIKKK